VEKAARNWQDEAAALKAYRTFLVFLFRNIRTQTGYYKKEIVIWLQISSAAVLPNII